MRRRLVKLLPKGNAIALFAYFYLAYAALVSIIGVIVGADFVEEQVLPPIATLGWYGFMFIGCTTCFVAAYKKDLVDSYYLERAGLILVFPATLAYGILLAITPGQQVASTGFLVFLVFVVARYIQLKRAVRPLSLKVVLDDRALFDKIANRYYEKVMDDPELRHVYDGLTKEEVIERVYTGIEAIDRYERTGKFARHTSPKTAKPINEVALIKLVNHWGAAALVEGVPYEVIVLYIIKSLALNKELIRGT